MTTSNITVLRDDRNQDETSKSRNGSWMIICMTRSAEESFTRRGGLLHRKDLWLISGIVRWVDECRLCVDFSVVTVFILVLFGKCNTWLMPRWFDEGLVCSQTEWVPSPATIDRSDSTVARGLRYVNGVFEVSCRSLLEPHEIITEKSWSGKFCRWLFLELF